MIDRATSRGLAGAAWPGVLGDWSRGRGPRYRQLARAIAAAIERGSLAPHEQLPSERALARLLSVSRGTAVGAYDELVGDGTVVRRRGSGTYVAGTGALALPPGREGSALVHRLVERSTAAPSDVVDLSISVIHEPGDLPGLQVSGPELVGLDPDSGYSPFGLAPLRAAIAREVTSWGLPTTPGEVVVTTGAQQALSVAAACWLRPGDRVVVEDPTYPGAIAAFQQAGAELVGVPTDGAGVRPDALERALRERPALVYLQPDVHNPTGAVLSAGRRAAIAAMVDATGVPLVEDAALRTLAWGAVPAPVASAARHATVVTVGSLSKAYWGGLRLGFARAPEPVALRLARVKATRDLGTSAVSQVLATRLLGSPAAADHVAARPATFRARHRTLTRELAQALPDWTWLRPAGGLSLWVRLPVGDVDAFAQVALRHGVAVATPGALSVSGTSDHLRLCFSVPEEQLVEGVRRLAAAWSRHRGW